MHLNTHSLRIFFVSLLCFMISRKLYIIILLSSFLCAKCTENGVTTLHGTINGNVTQITLFKEGLHYKYAEHYEEVLKINEKGEFSTQIKLDSPDVFYLRLFNHDYPVYLEPGKRTTVAINTNRFPLGTKIRGVGRELNNIYQDYLSQIMSLEQHALSERRNFLRGESNDYLNLQKLRVQLSKEYLAGTTFEKYLQKNIGDLLFAKLEKIRINKNEPGFDANIARKAVLEKALEKDFFSLQSLKAQRAGIRDFANLWAGTFGIQTELEEIHDRKLMEYDWKRLGFERLNSKKFALLDNISDNDAIEFARMYLIAEMLGEGDFKTAASHYYAFITESNDENYALFLDDLYNAVKRIQPGEKAPDFQLADLNNELHSLSDYIGKYVLLDFWASWCVPCLNEFQHLQRIYDTYATHDLEIISISIEEDKETWLKMAELYPHPWIQLFSGGGFNHPAFSIYRPGGIPFYVLIDRNGYIIRLNDIRPSFNFDEEFKSILYNEKEFTLRN